ncbi:50S ribosomal protein L18 [Lyticum sinuosum]|uniref:Large ribosomal subunit protein uL18 n=1 Tax=Lyticum sinuosum TaxID=1332059 RepID=A0AAE4VKU9_9RICK|nr:50S ribosomal protein L18 [Lyticum sinuosum]MDZ5761450.1 50S ribosomal protein L18 [Lyticum sinuosum]
MNKKQKAKIRRAERVRYKIRKICRETGTHRLSVKKTNLHIYAQIIDDRCGKTIVSYSTLKEKDPTKNKIRVNMSNKQNAKKVGEQIASLALKAGIEKVVFDRGERRYHGCIAELAQAARQTGLKI